ncbi:MAG: YigZ family protein, partial [Chloroflexota bacterium]
MLAVLEGSDLGDIAVVVTRYWGGIKLGTGGLVRAYGDAVKAVLEVLPKAQKIPTHTVMLAIPYTHLERVRLLTAEYEGNIQDETFAADITLVMQFKVEQFDRFQLALNELSHGSLAAEIIETNDASIFPVGG